MDQLVENDLVILGHIGADLAPGVLGRDIAAQLHQPVDGQPVPLLQIVVFARHQGQLGGGVVDEGCQVVPIPLGHAVAEQLLQLLLHLAGGGVEDVQEGLVLTVDIRHKMLGALGQIQNGLKPDNLCAGCLNRGILPGQQPQIVQLLRGKGTFFHLLSLFSDVELAVRTQRSP